MPYGDIPFVVMNQGSSHLSDESYFLDFEKMSSKSQFKKDFEQNFQNATRDTRDIQNFLGPVIRKMRVKRWNSQC